jgi:hypothetical protein
MERFDTNDWKKPQRALKKYAPGRDFLLTGLSFNRQNPRLASLSSRFTKYPADRRLYEDG